MRIVNRYRLELGVRAEMLLKILDIENMFGERLEAYHPSVELAESIKRLTEKNQRLLHSYAPEAEARHESIASSPERPLRVFATERWKGRHCS